MITNLKEGIDYFYSRERTIYGKFVYFFKREIIKDHYFENNGKVYLLKHNPDNYDPSITETGRHSDSFKIHIDKCEDVTIEFNKKGEKSELPKESIVDIINTIEVLLNKTKEELEKLKKFK